jgi:hypothetical protein
LALVNEEKDIELVYVDVDVEAVDMIVKKDNCKIERQHLKLFNTQKHSKKQK